MTEREMTRSEWRKAALGVDIDELQAALLETALLGQAIASNYYWLMANAPTEFERWLYAIEYKYVMGNRVLNRLPIESRPKRGWVGGLGQ